MKTTKILISLLIVLLFNKAPSLYAGAKPVDDVPPRARCPVCGMFTAKYPNWIAQIHYGEQDQIRFFDGVKDMMVFYLDPQRYEGPARDSVTDIYVRDYYTLGWLQAKEAFYVVGSDIYGPMGHELVPFGSGEAAESFQKDHHGRQVLTFEQITPELIDSLRSGQKMR